MPRIPWSYWLAPPVLALMLCACAAPASSPIPPASPQAREQAYSKLLVGIYGAAPLMGHAMAPEEYARVNAVLAIWEAGAPSQAALAEAIYLELMRQISSDPSDERAWGELSPKEQQFMTELARLRFTP